MALKCIPALCQVLCAIRPGRKALGPGRKCCQPGSGQCGAGQAQGFSCVTTALFLKDKELPYQWAKEKKKYVIVSISAEKAVDKIQYPFMIKKKTTHQTMNREELSQLDK